MSELETFDEVLDGELVDGRDWTPQQAADRISRAWQGAVESIVETGRRLIEEKAKAGHGQWLKVVELLPFSDATAQKLMVIAKHPDLANASHGRYLPPTWTTLYALTPLPAGEVPRRIEAHEITPELERAQAQEIAAQYLAAQQEALNAYSQACDGLVAALSWARAFEPPDQIPDNYLPADRFVQHTRALNDITAEWKRSE